MASSDQPGDAGSTAGNWPASPRMAAPKGRTTAAPKGSPASGARRTGAASRTTARPREQEAAKEWIREHEEVALIGAFALGVFIGAFMKS